MADQPAYQSYPLAWPKGWPRLNPNHRTSAKFSTGGRSLDVGDGVNRVFLELERHGINTNLIVVSTNIKPILGTRGYTSTVSDPGVAVYWQDKKKNHRVIALDRYNRVADNLGAIAATLEAMRAIERHGGAQILDRAFEGFAALPSPGQGPRPWRQVLGVFDNEKDEQKIREAYLRARSKTHSDKPGGDDAEFVEVQRAFEEARAEIGF